MLFCTETMRVPSPEGHSIVETMMLADTKLWKCMNFILLHLEIIFYHYLS